MKKEFRVKSEMDFKKIFDKRQSKANKQFVIYYLEKENQTHIRVGLSVSKKLGNAVVRNGIKRKIRRAFHELKGSFQTNYDIIVIARTPIIDMSVEDIKKSLLHVAKLCQIMN
ncbi:ribonuclease P protein component [Carnobacteriaceae bacterium zg-ZUI252]|nr:ribonuclease P protein component [Carnobacteriaceae bacterium zg-ZUI252]